jgi:hypothetical protein
MQRKRAHILSWGIFLLIGAAGIGYFRIAYHHEMSAAPVEASGQSNTIHSFLLLRIPEITSQYESGIETMKQRIDEWLDAVVSAGFHPLLLSEAMRRLQENEGLPERTVVFFFNPGYRKTMEIVAPIFAHHGCPAVCLTDQSAMRRYDRRYITFHAARLMRASGQWDVGFMDRQGHYSIEDERQGKKPFVTAAQWSPIAGALALNRKNDLQRMNYLTVNADWVAAELVNRLEAESPANDKVFLGKAVIHSREWGITSPREVRFDLAAPLNNRSARLFWMGTRSHPDFRINFSVGSLIGEIWLVLRFDEVSGSAIQVIMSGKDLVVEQRDGGVYKRLMSFPMQRSFQESNFGLGLTMRGQNLSISIYGKTYLIVCPAASSSAGRGIIQVFLTDKIRGIAKAQHIRMLFTPLHTKGKDERRYQ